MEFLKFDKDACLLCGICIRECPFGALSMGEDGIAVSDACRMCGVCAEKCPVGAITFEQKMDSVDKSLWRDILVFAELELGRIHPVTIELIGEALKLAEKVDYRVNCVAIGPSGTREAVADLLYYGVDKVYVYENDGFAGFKPDCYADAFADCIAETRPSAVLIGATPMGRSLAPRLSTRFHTGLTADCTVLDIEPNTDMVQIRPAFGGNLMAQIAIAHSRPQFATVRYRVMDRAPRQTTPSGELVMRAATDAMARSDIAVVSQTPTPQSVALEEQDVIVVAGRGCKNTDGVALCQELADALGATLAFTRPMVEMGFGDQAHQIGLSGRTVRPRLIITCGVSGAIQFRSCMADSACIVAIDSDPDAAIFQIAHYCLVDDLFDVVPRLTELARSNSLLQR